jgi:Rrf2 family transcriptional regulator, iron-sulfur cluster assembly transcription factor
MHLTTKGRFAVTAMMDLVLHSDTGPVSLSSISHRQHISLSYLEQLFGRLRRHQLVASTRGPGGGYTLHRKADQITVADIIVAVDDRIDVEVDHALANGQEPCMAQALWASLNAKMIEYLGSVTLRKLINDQIDQKNAMAHASPSVLLTPKPALKPQPPHRSTTPNSVFALAYGLAD